MFSLVSTMGQVTFVMWLEKLFSVIKKKLASFNTKLQVLSRYLNKILKKGDLEKILICIKNIILLILNCFKLKKKK